VQFPSQEGLLNPTPKQRACIISNMERINPAEKSLVKSKYISFGFSTDRDEPLLKLSEDEVEKENVTF